MLREGSIPFVALLLVYIYIGCDVDSAAVCCTDWDEPSDPASCQHVLSLTDS